MSRPIIALLTDFGLHDHYVGVMKGVMLGICPEAQLVDISHDIAPQDVLSGALELSAAYQFFPTGTTFLAVVDPGVGSARRAIAAEAGDCRFVGPDNGVLSLAFGESPRVVEISNPQYARAAVSRTFEGRDRFAPAAAWLATGLPIERFGAPVGDVARVHVPIASAHGGLLVGEVLKIDRFGNVITNITAAQLASFAAGGTPTVHIGGTARVKVVNTYADAARGELCALIGSSDRLELAVTGGSAADVLAATRGAAVHVRRGA